MSSSVPIVRQFSWTSILPQILVIILLTIIASIVGLNDFLSYDGFLANLMWGTVGQLTIWFLLRYTIAKDHTKGMRLVKKGKFSEAIPFFIESYETFAKHAWLDKYRHFILSSSKMTYKEMGLNNIAFCYSQIGDKENSILYYKRTLSEFPDSGMAKAALTFIDTVASENNSHK